MPAILAGLKVIELTHMVAAPVCGQILATLGADVTKIEPPGGDIARSLGPRWGTTSALFAVTNPGKHSVRADIRDPQTAAQVRAMALEADVVICNIDRSFVAAAGLDAESLRRDKSELIYVEVTGFGLDGPSGTDGLAQAAMGMMSLTAAQNGPAFRTGASVIDVSTGVFAALGVLAALERRRQTGRGDYVHVSLADACLYLQFTHLGMYAGDPDVIHRLGNHSHVSCTPMFTTSDGRILTSILHARHWEKFCELAGAPELAGDPRFATNAQRCEGQSTIEDMLNPLFAKRTRAEWVHTLRAGRIPCGPERSYAEVFADAELWQSGMFSTLPTEGHNALQLRLPITFAEGETAPPAASPELGESDALPAPQR
ncbi:MAG: CaiB/BaiF CoA-transferase family protein [Candidatus Velthaea sp.]